MRWLLGCLAVVAVVVSASASAGSRDGVIVFGRWTPGAGEGVYLVRPDGGGVKRLTLRGSELGPRLSPDGRRVVAVAADTLVVRDLSGRVLQRIATRTSSSVSQAQWSPDGRWISYLVERCEDPDDPRGWSTQPCADLWIVRPDGSGRRRLVNATVDLAWDADAYAWAPDGRRLVYQRAVERGSRLVILDVPGGRRRPIPYTTSLYAASPAWSPDGSRIAYARQRAPHRGNDLVTIRPEGTPIRRLTRTGNVSRAAWSPDGSRVAYYRDAPRDQHTLLVSRADGTRTWQVAKTTSDAALVWSPDGTRIAWSGDELSDDWVYLAPADGRAAPRRLAAGSLPDWR